MSKEIYLILHNIRSLHNVGSIFRTADAAGVKKIFLTGYTGLPIDKFGKIRQEVHKVALGAEKNIKWEYHRDIGKLIKNLKALALPSGSRTFLVALEQTPQAIDYRKYKPKFPLALIVGNEVRGLSRVILRKCDAAIEIPMQGKMVRHAHHPKKYHPEQGREKESLNVGVAAGIALFELIK